MKKKNIYVIAICLLLFSSKTFAQHFELGAMVGASNYFGDLAPTPVAKETHAAYGAFARLNLSGSFAFTGSITNATISGDDKNFDYNRIRNLNFNTTLTEYAGIIEFNYFKFGVDVNEKRFSPYIYLGLALTEYNPSATYYRTTTQLRNIRTEEVQYGLFSVVVPFGIGLKWQFQKHIAMNWNFGFRRSYSDYLDDVSKTYPGSWDEINTLKKGNVATATDPSAEANGGIPISQKGYRRGNSDFTDWYMITQVSLSYRFYKRMKCRRFY